MDSATRRQLHEAIVGLANGDRARFPEVFAELWPRVLRFVKRTIGEAPDAEDVAQRVLINIFFRIAEFDTSRDGVAWVFGVAAWEVRTHLRQRQRRRETPTSEVTREPETGAPSPETLAIQRDLDAALEDALGALTPAESDGARAASDSRRTTGPCQPGPTEAAPARAGPPAIESGVSAMTDVLVLERRARRAYEWGRVWMAVRVLPWLVLLAAFSRLGVGVNLWLALVGVTWLALPVALRWRSRAGVDDVRIGLEAGLIPYVAGLWACRIAACPTFGVISPQGAACVGLGALAGAWIGLRGRELGAAPVARIGAAIAVAMLAAALGCADLGLGNVIGISLGIVAGAGVVRATAPPAAA